MNTKNEESAAHGKSAGAEQTEDGKTECAQSVQDAQGAQNTQNTDTQNTAAGKDNGGESGESGAKESDAQGKLPFKCRVVEYIVRCLVLCVGLFIMSIGVGLSIQADLGTSPISSVPTVLWHITELSVGTTTIIVNTAIVLIQIIILRKKFKPIQLLQIPVCVVFGLLCDLSLSFLGGVAPTEYWQQWLICIAGIALVAVGVSIEVAANVITLAGEGLALAMCQVLPKIKFGYMKVICDSSLVVIAVILSLVFLHGLEGVREGTVAAAIFVGLIAKQLNKFTVPAANKLFSATIRLMTAKKSA